MQCQEILASELARISPIYDIVVHGSLGTADFSFLNQSDAAKNKNTKCEL